MMKISILAQILICVLYVLFSVLICSFGYKEDSFELWALLLIVLLIDFFSYLRCKNE